MVRLFSQGNKKIGILGLNKTGIASYAALSGIAAQIICYDDNRQNCKKFQEIYADAKILDISNDEWTKLDKILLSPGIPLSHRVVGIARSHGIVITSDIDLLFEELRLADFVAVTGTNGKSTTTALTSHILQSAKIDYPAGGNLGNAALSLPADKDGYVLELSSFQLELINNFRAKIAILLNITPDHLDRHLTMDNYINAKQKILLPLDHDSLCYRIIGVDNHITKNIFNSLKNNIQSLIKIIPISAIQSQEQGVAVLESAVHDDINGQSITIELPYIKSLQGVHNRENIAASYAACRILGLTPQQIIKAAQSFVGLPHRMQYIGSIDNIDVYNDSKATNADAAIKSISTLDNIYWLAGGIAKTGGIEAIKPWFNRIKKAYLFGQDKGIFAKTLAGLVDVCVCQNLEEAVDKAFDDAMNDKKQANILLAPAASSYDQFSNFEDRGEKFIELCQTVIARL